MNIFAGSVPPEQCVHGEGMPIVMNPRRTPIGFPDCLGAVEGTKCIRETARAVGVASFEAVPCERRRRFDGEALPLPGSEVALDGVARVGRQRK